MEDRIMEMMQAIAELSAQVSVINNRMGRLEELIEDSIKQEQRLNALEESLDRAHSRISKNNIRLDVLEKAGGKRAQSVVNAVLKYIGTAILGFLVATITAYFAGGH